jgi:peptidoglycan/LPS O-acetylase OafA/YrhL
MLLAARERRRGKSGLPVVVKALAAAGSFGAYLALLKMMGSSPLLNLASIACGMSSVYWFYQAADAASARLPWAWPGIEFVAGISYEIYLLHYMIIVFAHDLLPLWAAPGFIAAVVIGLSYGVNKVSSRISGRLSAMGSGPGPERSRA